MPVQQQQLNVPGLIIGQRRAGGPAAAAAAAQGVGARGGAQIGIAPVVPTVADRTGELFHEGVRGGLASFERGQERKFEATERQREREFAARVQAGANLSAFLLQLRTAYQEETREQAAALLNMYKAAVSPESPIHPRDLSKFITPLVDQLNRLGHVTMDGLVDRDKLGEYLSEGELAVILDTPISSTLGINTMRDFILATQPGYESQAFGRMARTNIDKMIVQARKAAEVRLINPYQMAMHQSGYIGEFDDQTGLAKAGLEGYQEARRIADVMLDTMERKGIFPEADFASELIRRSTGEESYLYKTYIDRRGVRVEHPGIAKALAYSASKIAEILTIERNSRVEEEKPSKRTLEVIDILDRAIIDLSRFFVDREKETNGFAGLDEAYGVRNLAALYETTSVTGSELYGVTEAAVARTGKQLATEAWGIPQEKVAEISTAGDALRLIGELIAANPGNRLIDGVGGLPAYKDIVRPALTRRMQATSEGRRIGIEGASWDALLEGPSPRPSGRPSRRQSPNTPQRQSQRQPRGQVPPWFPLLPTTATPGELGGVLLPPIQPESSQEEMKVAPEPPSMPAAK